jgi:hypothetical protein
VENLPKHSAASLSRLDLSNEGNVMGTLNQIQAIVLSFTITMMVIPGYAASREGPAESENLESMQAAPATTSGTPSDKELQQLVAPIALYPDALVAQILAGATYPIQVVEAERWMKQNQNLKGNQLASAIDQQPWDPSIKALCEFPQVVDNMNKNLSWTSALGDAYFNDPNGVMNAIQLLRKDAQNAGNLKNTPQQTVSTEGQTIVIEPANPEVVYVPSYSPEIYGAPVAAYPGYSGWGAVAAGAISFGAGMAVGGAFGGYGWGWHGWGTDWHGGNVTFNRNTFISNSNTFANRNTRYNQAKGTTDLNRNVNKPSAGQFNRPSGGFNAASPQTPSMSRGFGSADHSTVGRSGGAFGGFGEGGSARGSSERGSSSFRGGGGGGRGGRR